MSFSLVIGFLFSEGKSQIVGFQMSYKNFHVHADGSAKQALGHNLEIVSNFCMYIHGLSLKYRFMHFLSV